MQVWVAIADGPSLDADCRLPIVHRQVVDCRLSIPEIPQLPIAHRDCRLSMSLPLQITHCRLSINASVPRDDRSACCQFRLIRAVGR
jgi:hypothetical protein